MELFNRVLDIALTTIKLVSNNRSLIYNPMYFEGVKHPSIEKGDAWNWECLQANFKVRDEGDESMVKALFYIMDEGVGEPTISISSNYKTLTAIGDWTSLEDSCRDKRYSLLGNQGLLFRYVLAFLEKELNVFNFHACGLYDENVDTVYLVLGERGSGKSAVLLSALNSNQFKAFSTEITHARITSEGVTFFKGSLRNNVRLGHLLYDFPRLMEDLGLRVKEGIKDPWEIKIQIDLKKYSVKEEKLINPRVIIVCPRIEEKVEKTVFKTSRDLRKIKRVLFENISDKLSSFLMYEEVPVSGFNDPPSLQARLLFINELLRKGEVVKVVSMFADPSTCIEALTE